LFLLNKLKKEKKKLIILLHGPISRREYHTFGIEYLKKHFTVSILEISPLVNSKHYEFKRFFKFKIIRNFTELENFFLKNQNSMCWETGFSYNSLRIAYLLKKNKIKIIGADGISSLPTRRFLNKTRHFQVFLRRLKLLVLNPLIFINRVSFSLQGYLRILRYRKIDIALIGGNSYSKYNGYEKAKDKIYCSSLDYSNYIKRKKYLKKKITNNYAVFIDTYLPFHPEHRSTQSKILNSNDYFKSLTNFFKYFEKRTKLKVIIALYPKADLKKYSLEIKKFKMISGRIVELIKNCKIVMHHGSTAQSYAVIFKKPTIYLTSNFLEKHKYIRDNSQRIEFMEQKQINIDNFGEKLLFNKKKLFSYNKKLYKEYFRNYLKHDLSKKVPWYVSFVSYFKNY